MSAMSSLHAVGGLLLLKHQVASAPSVVCPLIAGASCTTTTTAFATSSASGAVPHFAGLKRVKSVTSFSTRSLKSLPGTAGVGWSSPPGEKAAIMPRNWLKKLGFGVSNRAGQTDRYNSPAHGPDDDKPAPGLQYASFGAGCFWGPELAFQRVPGVRKTEVGYSQGLLHNPLYGDVCEGDTGHNEIVRVQYDPMQCNYENLLDVFWARHDPTTLNRQGGDVGTQYRSGIYYYNSEQEKAAKDSLVAHQAKLSKKIVTEILPAKKFYRAEEYHQQYLAKGGRFGFRQSAEKGCSDPIRCYG